ncbi:MAG: ABC transporter permease [Clostridiales bacterium]|nr:ABC transporter permease [Clostridiales bacterium]
MSKAKKFWAVYDKIGVLFFIALVGIVFFFLDSRIVSGSNLLNVLSNASMIGICGAGMTFALCSGGFDLSIGYIFSWCGLVYAQLVPVFCDSMGSIGVFVALLVAMLVGALCGVVNGLVITKLKIVPFVATLATCYIWRGAALLWTNGSKITIIKNEYPAIEIFSTGKLFGVIPASVIMMVIVFLIAFLLYKFTKFGVAVRSVGSNEAAARITGVKADATLIGVYVTTGVTAAIASVVNASMLMLAEPASGAGYDLQAITSTILGGTALDGGRGNVWGTMFGAFLLMLLNSGLNILGVPQEYQRLARGLILLLALTVGSIKILTKGGEE